MKLDNKSRIPLYKQLKEIIRDMILSGRLTTGERILTETEMSEEYGVSRITVRKAISDLTDEGYLLKIQGKGTFVRSRPAPSPLKESISFSQLCKNQGLVASAKIIQLEMIPAEERELEFFQLHPGSYVVTLKRVRLASDVPVSIETNCFHPAMSMLLGEDFAGSMYKVLEKYGYYPGKGVHVMGISYADQDEARYLGVTPHTPLLLNNSKVYDRDEKALYTCRQIVRVDSGVYQYYV